MSAPGGDDPPPAPSVVNESPTQTVVMPLHFEPFGPTLAETLEKHAQDTLTGSDIADYLAIEKALAEMGGKTRLSLPFEAVNLIAEKLVGLKVWSQKVNDSRKAVKEKRDKELQDIANGSYRDPKIEAIKIAKDFLAEAVAKAEGDATGIAKEFRKPLHDLLQVWKPKQNAYGLMTKGALRKIIAKRGKRLK